MVSLKAPKRTRILTWSIALAAASQLISVVSPAQASQFALSALPCSARVSNVHPTDYSSLTVYVKTRPRAVVQTTANYRTTSTTHSGVANSSGNAAIAYRISRATSGFTVIVTVVVHLEGASGRCRTSFTPV
jgi:hypothetical protein